MTIYFIALFCHTVLVVLKFLNSFAKILFNVNLCRLTADVQDFKSAFKQVISQGLRSTTQTIGCMVSLYFISPKLTLFLGTALPLIIVSGTLIGSGLRRLSRAAQEQVARATAIANEALGNVRTVRAFAMEEKETK